MKIVMFYHSLISDWNHGNAHFLRGVATELQQRGNDVHIYEPAGGWSATNLMKDHGEHSIREFEAYYPALKTNFYNPDDPCLWKKVQDADLVIVHEWNDHELVKEIGELKSSGKFILLFHDTHHRAVTEKEAVKNYDLSKYDGVLAFGKVIKDLYVKENWAKQAWTWHEAADTRIFHPRGNGSYEGDVVWIGNWGDDERSKELNEFLIEPVKALRLKAKVFGVRYPKHALAALAEAGIEYGGWLPNYKVPEVFASYKMTVHVPRRPYVVSLPGIPTIRPFEAMACGIPLLSAPWADAENLFTEGLDYVMVSNGTEMRQWMHRISNDPSIVFGITSHALETIREKHSCAIRADELTGIVEAINKQYSSLKILAQ